MVRASGRSLGDLDGQLIKALCIHDVLLAHASAILICHEHGASDQFSPPDVAQRCCQCGTSDNGDGQGEVDKENVDLVRG